MDLAELTELAEKERLAQKSIVVRCCSSTGCQSSGSLEVKKELEKAIAERGLEDRVQLIEVGCMAFCGRGPIVQVDPDGPLYEVVRPEQAASIIAALDGGEATAERGDPNHPFYARQVRIVQEHSGVIDPERIEAYIAVDGYQSLYHVLHDLSPTQVVEEITKSGLRGRGGAGFPTGLKWATVAKTASDRKYVVCNADEGDPGAFMDRSVLESDPHRVLEGMAIAGYAVGATQGFVYVRAEYPLAIQRLQKAINQAKRHGLLGSQIFESKFDFRVDIRIGAGAFVCGEETALLASIEGKRGTPRPRPPFPAAQGLWGHPTLINNVETFANIVPIIQKGADWYAGIGTEKSKGTKIFSLTGKIRNTGLIEVPMGIPLRDIVEEIGGGVTDGGTVKAIQTGGPAGGCIPAKALDTPVDYESLNSIGCIMGSGGMIVMDQADDMVDVARFFMEFCMDESCGKCIPCRAGTVQIHRLLTRIRSGEATAADVAQLESLCDMVSKTSLCGLGQLAPNPVVSTLRYFREEYEAKLRTAQPVTPSSLSPDGNGTRPGGDGVEPGGNGQKAASTAAGG